MEVTLDVGFPFALCTELCNPLDHVRGFNLPPLLLAPRNSRGRRLLNLASTRMATCLHSVVFVLGAMKPWWHSTCRKQSLRSAVLRMELVQQLC